MLLDLKTLWDKKHKTFTLFAGTGTFTLTGQAATLNVGLVADFGSFTLTGEAVNLNVGLAASSGSFTLTGQSVTLNVGLASAFGSFAFTGEVVTLGVGLPAAFGAFAESGQNVTLTASIGVANDPGAPWGVLGSSEWGDLTWGALVSQVVIPRVPSIPYTVSGESAGPAPDWLPRDLAELLGLDSPLTIEEIRRRLNKLPVVPGPAVVPEPQPVPYIPLFPTPNIMIANPEEEEELLLVMTG